MDIDFPAIVAAALSGFLLGRLWYSPHLFRHPLNRAMGRDETSSGGHPARVFGLSFAFAFIAALAFAALLGSAPEPGPAVQPGLIISLCFVAMCIRYRLPVRRSSGQCTACRWRLSRRPVSALHYRARSLALTMPEASGNS